MSTDRRHTAIMFTDIVGYTALMGSNEDKAFELLSKNRDIHKVLIQKYNGTLIKEIGDGMLISFGLASDAVYCGLEIQNECKNHDIPLKIGIHEGEHVFAGEDILGDSVNIASRLESETQRGCIHVSSSVYHDIKNRPDISAKYLGEKSFKNVKDKIKVYEVSLKGAGLEKNKVTDHIEAKQTKNHVYLVLAAILIASVAIVSLWKLLPNNKSLELEKTLGVMPFRNLSPNPEDQYLADGMMETILSHLQRIEDITVRSRSSMQQYQKYDADAKEIGRDIKVNFLLEGSFQKVDEKANLIVRLIRTDTDATIWTEEYYEDWSEVFLIQKKVAKTVVDMLYVKITNLANTGIEKSLTENMLAYEFYLKGNESYKEAKGNVYIIPYVEKSISYYRKAIELDDRFSYAFTGLGRSLHLLSSRIPSKEESLLIEASSNLSKAIDLDKYNGWAHSELAAVNLSLEWDTASAKTHLDIALSLTPNDENIYINDFFLKMRFLKYTDLELIKNRLFKISPNLSDPFDDYNLIYLYCNQEYTEIEKLFDLYWEEVILTKNKRFGVWQGNTFFNTFLMLKNKEKGELVLTKMDSAYFQKPKLNRAILKAICDGNKKPVQDYLEKWGDSQHYHYDIASLYASIGDREKMYSHLELASNAREGLLQWLNLTAVFYPYHNEDRYKEIQAKIWTPVYH